MKIGTMRKLWGDFPYLWAIKQNWMSGIVQVSVKRLDREELLTVVEEGKHSVWFHRRLEVLEVDVWQDRIEELCPRGEQTLLDVMCSTCQAHVGRQTKIDAVIVCHSERTVLGGTSKREFIVVYKAPLTCSITELVCQTAQEIERIRNLPIASR